MPRSASRTLTCRSVRASGHRIVRPSAPASGLRAKRTVIIDQGPDLVGMVCPRMTGERPGVTVDRADPALAPPHIEAGEKNIHGNPPVPFSPRQPSDAVPALHGADPPSLTSGQVRRRERGSASRAIEGGQHDSHPRPPACAKDRISPAIRKDMPRNARRRQGRMICTSCASGPAQGPGNAPRRRLACRRGRDRGVRRTPVSGRPLAPAFRPGPRARKRRFSQTPVSGRCRSRP